MTARIGLSAAFLGLTAAPVLAEPNVPPAVAVAEPPAVMPPVKLEPPASPTPLPDPAVPALTAAAPSVCPPNAPQVWVQGDLLCWWIPSGPLRFPLVTTGDPTLGPLAGTLGQPGTRVLFGGDNLDYGRAAGARLTIGGWAESEPVGAEVSAFWLDPQDVTFAARSNSSGSPALYFPVFNLVTGSPTPVIVADPIAGYAGDVTVHSRSHLWGAEANGLTAISRGPVELSLLYGVRYVDLKESLGIQNNATDLYFGTRAAMLDEFEATNRFYGGQVGGRVTANAGRWFVGLTYKVAVGTTHQVLDVTGVTVQAAVPQLPSGTFPGAVFAQPTNMGRHSAWQFAAVPELNLRAGCQVTSGLRAFVGYDLLYWSRVIRPGLEMDRELNLSQSPVFGTGALAGAARPAFLQNQTDFFAQGLTAGLEFRY